MGKYESTVGEQLKKPDAYHAYVYPAFGLKIGRGEYPWGNIEMYIPVTVRNSVSSFVKVSAGFGIQLSVQLPVGKHTSIGEE